MTESDIAAIRTTARYHVAAMLLDKLRRESRRRVTLRHASASVSEVALWLDAALELDKPDRLGDVTVAAALSDCGFALKLMPDGQLRTDCSASAAHRWGYEFRNASEPLEQHADGTWHASFPGRGMRWAERLAALDADLALQRVQH